MSTRRITLASLLVTIAVYAFLVYRRRWISDDNYPANRDRTRQ